MKDWLDKKGLTVGEFVKVVLCMGTLVFLVGVLAYGAIGAALQ